MIAAPLSVKLMEYFHSPHRRIGVAETFAALGVIYFVYMMFGVFTVRVPRAGVDARSAMFPREHQRSSCRATTCR